MIDKEKKGFFTSADFGKMVGGKIFKKTILYFKVTIIVFNV